jgi:hypothetical protein
MQYFAPLLKLIFVTVGICSLTACTTQSFSSGPAKASALPEQPVPISVFNSLDPPVQFPRPSMKPHVPRARNQSESLVAVSPENAGSILRLNPETLLGYSEADVAQLLGDATENVRSPPSRILHYKFADCRVTLYLYASLDNGVYRVLYSEIGSESPLQPAGEQAPCLIRTARLPVSKMGSM